MRTVLDEFDIRRLPVSRQLPEVAARFEAMAVGESVTLIGSGGDLVALRAAFERDWPGACRWQQTRYEADGSRDHLTKLAATRLPRVLTNAVELAETVDGDAGGARWKLETSPRDLDSNLVHLPARDRIDTHRGPELDVMMIVVHGTGQVETEVGEVAVGPGDIVWLPRRSQRAIVAGGDGLSYLTVHPRRPPMTIGAAAPRTP
jgi:quercetin dioxygenase-like cupin family protein